MRNWPQTLRPASYKGAAFFVDEESLPKSGRFVATHHFVKAESHSTEDMGRTAREFRVSAYLASDTADTDVQAFVELCTEAGSGTLVLPILGPQQVRCRNCHVKAQRDKQGYVAIDLDFVEAGTADADGFPAAPLGDRLAAAANAQMPATAQSTLSAMDQAARQDAIARRLDPLGSANADRAVPGTTDYQGSAADAAARQNAFERAFAANGL